MSEEVISRAYEAVKGDIKNKNSIWLVTGAAGFIGSHLVKTLLQLKQEVIGVDNFSSGTKENLDCVRREVSAREWSAFHFEEGDVSDFGFCLRVTRGIPRVLHQAAVGSVPRSLMDPVATHRSNVDGFFNILKASADNKVEQLVYASSSAVYGDHPDLPKREDKLGDPLSPYAATKRINEIYAQTFFRSFGLKVIGLRYFNVFGPRQSIDGPYAAVIPQWVKRMKNSEEVVIYGDGTTSRDFCYVENAVQANLLAAMTDKLEAFGQVFNVATGQQTTLNELYRILSKKIEIFSPGARVPPAKREEFRHGDIRHSLSSLSRIREILSYEPTHGLEVGLDATLKWYFGIRG